MTISKFNTKTKEIIEVELTEQELLDLEQRNAAAAVEAAKQVILSQLQGLDNQITSRRITEALLTEEGKTWLADIESKKAVLRAKL